MNFLGIDVNIIADYLINKRLRSADGFISQRQYTCAVLIESFGLIGSVLMLFTHGCASAVRTQRESRTAIAVLRIIK